MSDVERLTGDQKLDANNLRSVAFPALGPGLYKVSIEQSFGAIATVQIDI